MQSAAEVAQVLGGTQELESPPQHGVVGGLAAVLSNGVELAGSVHGHLDVELVVGSPDEAGSELTVEDVGHPGRDGPGQNLQVQVLGAPQSGVGGPSVVGVAGDTAVVEHEESRARDLPCQPDHVGAEVVESDGVEGAIGIAEKLDPGDAERVASGGHLRCPDPGEVAWGGVQGGGLAVGETQHGDPAPGFDQGADQGAEAERLVVGVGADDQDAVVCGQGLIHRRTGRRH